MTAGNVLATWTVTPGGFTLGGVRFFVGKNPAGCVWVFTSGSLTGSGVTVASGWQSGNNGSIYAEAFDVNGEPR